MTVRQLLTKVLFLGLFFLGFNYTLDPDLWWHLAGGRYIAAHGIPFFDVFSFTKNGQPWVAHEWLGDWIYWQAYAFGGSAALMFLGALLVLAAFAAVYAAVVEGKPLTAACVTVLAAGTARAIFGWGLRPQLWTIFFLSVFSGVLFAVRRGRMNSNRLYLLPVLMLVWVNLHGGGYLAGIVLLVVYGLADWIQSRRGSATEAAVGIFTPQQRRMVFRAAGLCLLVSLANPQGARIWAYPFGTLFSSSMRQYLMEWYSPDFHMTENWFFLAYLVVGLVCFCFKKRPLTLAETLVFTGSLAAALMSQRHIPLFAVVAAPIVGGCLDFERHFMQNEDAARLVPWKKLFHVLILGAAVAAALLCMLNKAADNPKKIQEQFPVKAVDYLEKNALTKKKIYNAYGWGGYLIWKEIPVYIDGRADLYGEAFFSRYMEHYFLKPEKDFLKMLDGDGIEVVLLGSDSAPSRLLSASALWKRGYHDKVADVFVRALR